MTGQTNRAAYCRPTPLTLWCPECQVAWATTAGDRCWLDENHEGVPKSFNI